MTLEDEKAGQKRCEAAERERESLASAACQDIFTSYSMSRRFISPKPEVIVETQTKAAVVTFL